MVSRFTARSKTGKRSLTVILMFTTGIYLQRPIILTASIIIISPQPTPILTVTDFMAHQAQFRNKVFSLILLPAVVLLYVNTERPGAGGVKIDAANRQLKQIAGTLYRHGKPFTGYVFELYANGDTARTCTYCNGKQEGIMMRRYQNAQLAE